jgi:hypothetical protein
MGSHKAAKRCDRGFAAPFLVTKVHIDMPFSYLLDSLSRKPANLRPTTAIGDAGVGMGCS